MEALETLAHIRGVQFELIDALGQHRRTSRDSLLTILQSLGEPIERPEDAWDALSRPIFHHQVIVAWDGHASLSLPGETRIDARSDTGENWTALLSPQEGSAHFQVPFGVHDMHWEGNQAWVISAPRRAYGTSHRMWGVFAPLYALCETHRKTLASFGTLARAAKRTSELGGSLFATLPLLPVFAEAPRREPSPYAPVSRLFWNELYVELDALPEAQEFSFSLPQPEKFVDWNAEADARFPIFKKLVSRISGQRKDEFEKWCEGRRFLEEYVSHRVRSSWEHDPDMKQALQYAQWVAHTQLDEARGIYLDLPLGVHPDGFDVRHWPNRFVRGCSAGAPPDPLFSGGQNWGFPPMHPEHERAHGYSYLRECLSHHMQAADVLRIDHIAWLHRLYWIPSHASATDGAYVSHPHPEELYALLSLLSHRHQCQIIGEDLGTVPHEVREAMQHHGFWRTWVLQLFAHGGGWEPPPQGAVLTVNTHDLPLWRSWWEANDIDEWVELGLYDQGQAQYEREIRAQTRAAICARVGVDQSDPQAVLSAVMRMMATEDGELLLVTMEDLFAEVRPQNIPGTHRERPNWKGRAAKPVEAMNEYASFFEELNISRT